MELHQKTIHEVAADLKAKKLSSVELTNKVMDHLEKVEPLVQSFITVTRKEALAQAAEADKRLASGNDITPLTGVPIALKDLLCTKGVRTTCASRMLETFVPPYNATVVEKLNAGGTLVRQNDTRRVGPRLHRQIFPAHRRMQIADRRRAALAVADGILAAAEALA